MRYQLILNMPSQRGGSVHSIFVEYDAKTIDDLMGTLERQGYIVAVELYKTDGGGMDPHHEIGIPAMMVGKVKYLID